MINPMYTLPGYGAILKEHCNLDTSAKERTIGDCIGSVLDYLVGEAWAKFGLFPEEQKKHRQGVSILEIQEFLDWSMHHWTDDMELDPKKLDPIYAKAVDDFLSNPEGTDEPQQT